MAKIANIAMLRKSLRYDPEKGEFYRIKGSGTAHPGDRAGWRDKSTGYRKISFLGRPVYEHHLAWLYIHGHLSLKGREIDHRNSKRDDNRITNLRLVTKGQNRMHRAVQPGRLKGITWDKKNRKWRAKIGFRHKHICLGRFVTQREAALAYNAAAIRYHAAFSAINHLGEANV